VFILFTEFLEKRTNLFGVSSRFFRQDLLKKELEAESCASFFVFILFHPFEFYADTILYSILEKNLQLRAKNTEFFRF